MGIQIKLGVDSRAAVRGIKRFGSSVDNSVRKVGKLKASFSKIPAIGGLLGGAAVIGGLKKAISAAAVYEDSIAKINTVLRVSQAEMSKTKSAVDRLSIEYGKPAADIAEAGYTIASAQIRGADAFKTMEVASKLSVAGFTDVATTTAGLIAGMKTFGLAAEDVADLIALANDKGNISIGQFSNSISILGELAKSANLDLKDMSVSMAKMTEARMSPERAVTSLSAAIRLLTKEPAIDLVGDINEQGLVKTIERMQELQAAGDKRFKKLISTEAEAKIGILKLIQKEGLDVKALKAVKEETGLLAEQLARARTNALRLRQSEQILEKSFRDMGDVLLEDFSDGMEEAAKILKDMQDDGSLKSFGEGLKALVTTIGFLADDIGSRMKVGKNALSVAFTGFQQLIGQRESGAFTKEIAQSLPKGSTIRDFLEEGIKRDETKQTIVQLNKNIEKLIELQQRGNDVAKSLASERDKRDRLMVELSSKRTRSMTKVAGAIGG